MFFGDNESVPRKLPSEVRIYLIDLVTGGRWSGGAQIRKLSSSPSASSERFSQWSDQKNSFEWH